MTKKTRHKHLAVSAQRRAQEKLRRQRAVRMTLLAVTAAVVVLALGGGIVFLTGGEKPIASPTLTPPSPSAGPCEEIPMPAREAPPSLPGPFPMTIDVDATYTATLKTTCGQIKFRLDPQNAPNTVNNFVAMANAGWYNPMLFHRVENSIDIIQTGDPFCNGAAEACGSGGPGFSFPDELTGDEEYVTGTVAMANSGKDTNGSQFFIVTGKNGERLSPDYTVFGQVTKGLDVAKDIQDIPVSQSGQPLDLIWLMSVTIDES